MEAPFYNRRNELATLARAWSAARPAGQFLLLYGRRRLGKTYLLQRFFAQDDKPHAYFLADQTTAPAQRLALAEALLAALPAHGVAPEEIAVSWNALLRFTTQQCQGRKGRFGLILDEFPYLVAQSPELPSLLQAWWDREGSALPLFLVLCGSQLSVMEALGEASAPLYGRFTAGVLRLPPLSYDEVALFYPDYLLAEKLTLYAVFGGAARYHALVDPSRPVKDEVIDLLLRPRAALENEVAFLLSSEALRDPAPYNAVLAAVAQGDTQFGRIQDRTGIERGSLSFVLARLLELGWLRREFPFEESGERRALYRIADPFLAFWYRFVQPLRSALTFRDPPTIWDERVAPQLPQYLGEQVFESICHQWLRKRAESDLGLALESSGRWWSRDGQVELDVVARRSNGGYLLGECKWSGARPVDVGVYAELLAKESRVPDPRWREGATRALFSVGGFSPELESLSRDPANRLHLIGPDRLL